MIYDGSSATYRLKTIFSSALSVFPPIMILWRVRIISQVSEQWSTRMTQKQLPDPQFSYTFSLLSPFRKQRGSKTKDKNGQSLFLTFQLT